MSLYSDALEFKNIWDARFSEALSIEDTDAAINELDELKTMRDLFIRQTRRVLKRGQARITHTNLAMLTADELQNHNEIARRFELDADEIERLLDQWAAQPVMPEDAE
jgi:hypothetical protein